jgi:hypothetical protein
VYGSYQPKTVCNPIAMNGRNACVSFVVVSDFAMVGTLQWPCPFIGQRASAQSGSE